MAALADAGLAYASRDWLGAVNGYLSVIGDCGDPLGPSHGCEVESGMAKGESGSGER